MENEIAKQFKKKAQKEAFAVLDGFNILDDVKEACLHFTMEHNFGNTREFENAYLLLCAQRINNNPRANNRATINTTLFETSTNNIIESQIKTLKRYGEGYLGEKNSTPEKMQTIFTASLVHRLLSTKDPLKEDVIEALTNEDILTMAKQSKTLQVNKAPSAEQLLSLARLMERIKKYNERANTELEKSHAIWPETAQNAKQITEHVEAIKIKPDHSDLEDVLLRKYDLLKNDLKDAIHDKNVVPLFQIT